MRIEREDVPKYVLWGGVILALAFWKGRTVAQLAVDLATKGKRLTVTTLDLDGVAIDDAGERATPAELAAVASEIMGIDVSPDVYSLARMRRSEGTNGAELRMHVALNDLADLQRRSSLGLRSVTDLLTYSKYAGERGFYGDQIGRRYATSRDPYEGDVRLAMKVLADRSLGIDRAQGAIKFVDKASFGKQAGTRTYETVLAEWQQEGLEPFNSPDATKDLVLFRRA